MVATRSRTARRGEESATVVGPAVRRRDAGGHVVDPDPRRDRDAVPAARSVVDELVAEGAGSRAPAPAHR